VCAYTAALCADRVKGFLFYPNDNNGGTLGCFALGATPCPEYFGLFKYPSCCDVDESTSTLVVAEVDGHVYSLNYGASSPTLTTLYIESNPEASAMGVAFGCMGDGVTCDVSKSL
jgi:hypothetical protein